MGWLTLSQNSRGPDELISPAVAKARFEKSFWKTHECRVWQFSELRGGDGELHDGTDFGTGGVKPELYHAHHFFMHGDLEDANVLTFSPSLCKSGVELFGAAPHSAMDLPAGLKHCLTFYNRVRDEMKRHEREARKRSRGEPPPDEECV
jgi:hypothetical protein